MGPDAADPLQKPPLAPRGDESTRRPCPCSAVSDDEDPWTLPLDDVPFRFVGTWEPSLIVESIYEATVPGDEMTHSEGAVA